MSLPRTQLCARSPTGPSKAYDAMVAVEAAPLLAFRVCGVRSVREQNLHAVRAVDPVELEAALARMSVRARAFGDGHLGFAERVFRDDDPAVDGDVFAAFKAIASPTLAELDDTGSMKLTLSGVPPGTVTFVPAGRMGTEDRAEAI